MITAITLAILGFWLTTKHWFWDVLFFSLALLLTIVGGGFFCIFTLPMMAWCFIAFLGNIHKNK